MSIVAKKYVKALTNSQSSESLKDFFEVLSLINSQFSDAKFATLLTSNLTTKSEKEKILLVDSFSDEVKNFLKLLIEKNRIAEIPAITDELRVQIANIENQFIGKLYAPAGIDPIQLEKISTGIRAKVGSSVELQTFETENTDIVKVVIDDLNIEISVSRSRIENDMINHILTAL
jgi:F-type H+-transporting ATPase subunit delta